MSVIDKSSVRLGFSLAIGFTLFSIVLCIASKAIEKR